MFTREDGAPLRPAWISVRFDMLAARAGLPPITLHGLRHGAATMLLAAGQPPKVVSEIPGHRTVAFTMDVYTEVAEELAGISRSTIDRILAAFAPAGTSYEPAGGLSDQRKRTKALHLSGKVPGQERRLGDLNPGWA